jgi:pyridoxamine 5'-phosphate oxidase
MTDDLRTLLRGLAVFAGDLPEFDTGAAPGDPVALFTEWLRLAIRQGIPEPHVMTLSTVDAMGNPSSRALILKDVDESGWQFASTSAGRKGCELAGRPYAALNFYWQPLGRQVRVRGPVRSLGPEAGACDFLARSAGARAESLAGRQSEPLGHTDQIETAAREARERLTAQPDLVSPDWTLYTVQPDEVEFWQADKQRRHRRLHYTRRDGGWAKGLLWP